jgi:hypothetical protein
MHWANRHRVYLGLTFAVAMIPLLEWSAAAQSQLKYPDLSVIVPTGQISIVNTASGRVFQYTHDTFNGGGGPLEIQPVYNSASGNYQGYQHVYSQDTAGNWSLAQSIPITGAFVFDSAHGHFHFPLVSFGLYTVTTAGGIGTPVAVSDKVGFCIDDSFIYDPTLPNAGAFGDWGSCTDPTSLRGLSVGAVDEYDQTDEGQSIAIGNLPDGMYWLHIVVDPEDFLAESKKTNNETDVLLTITGTNVTVLQTTVPTLPALPVVSVTSPTIGAQLSGTATLTASASGNSGAAVQYLVDGQPIGAPVTTSPYTLKWDTTTVAPGTHWLAAQTTNPTGQIGTSPVIPATVSQTIVIPPGSPTIDAQSSAVGKGSISTSISTTGAADLLLAFVSADGPLGGAQSATVTSGNIVWSLVQRSNTQAGDAEIWTAKASSQLSGVAVNSTLASPNYDACLTVIAFKGASGLGASANRSALNGAPQIGLTATQAGSITFGVGHDWDSATARTTPQLIVYQDLDTSAGDTCWVQSQTAPATAAGVSSSIFDTAPTLDRWDLSAVEVLPTSSGSTDTTPPTVQLTSPQAGATVSGQVTLAANASDDGTVASVTFYVDNVQVGAPVTTPPYQTIWDTTKTTTGQHSITVTAVDGAGNKATTPATLVTVSATPPPSIVKDATAIVDGHDSMTTSAFSTSVTGDLLVAFVAFDGPSTTPQTASVSGAGLTWTLLKRSNAQPGTAEIWSAKATGKLSGATVTAAPGVGTGYHGSLTVIAFANTNGAGIVGQASAPNGAPDIYLPGIPARDWVFAVGNDWDNAISRVPVSGQVLVHQRVDTAVGDTYWVQSTSTPSTVSGLVDIHDTSPTTDRWDYVAVDIVAL